MPTITDSWTKITTTGGAGVAVQKSGLAVLQLVYSVGEPTNQQRFAVRHYQTEDFTGANSDEYVWAKVADGKSLHVVVEEILGNGEGLSESQSDVLSHFTYDQESRILISDRAIETTLNSLYLGNQHKMSSGSENIYFTNLNSNINFFPMWGGLKDQSITANQGSSGFIPPSGRVYSDFFSLPLGGQPDPLNSTGYSGENYFDVNISGLGITTVAAESVAEDVRLEYRININNRQVYMQELPRASARSSAGTLINPGDVIEWFFDHPVDVHAGTTLVAEIIKVGPDDVDLGIFQVQRGDVPDPSTGLYRYQATVHNRLYEDKDIELISPYLKYQAMDFCTDSTGVSILLRDLSLPTGEQMLVPHNINTVEAVAVGTTIQLKVKDGAKVLVESLPVAGASINGTLVNSVLNNAVTELNSLFTNGLSFASQGNPVQSFVLSGDNLVLGLADSTSYSVDITTLGVDTNNFVSSGAVVGTDLVLTMSDATTVTINATNMINGSTTSATSNGWTFSYGQYAGDPVNNTQSNLALGIAAEAPFSFGPTLASGSEMKWNHNSTVAHNLGIWDGLEAKAGTFNSRSNANWAFAFKYSGGYIAGPLTTLTNTTQSNKYVPSAGAELVIRFLQDGHVVLVDLSGTTEVEIAKTTNSRVETTFFMQLGCDQNFVFPNAIITESDNLWDIVHDLDNSQGSSLLTGIEKDTVIKSGVSIVMGEKIMFMLDEDGRAVMFGTAYTGGASSGITDARNNLANTFMYQTNEALVFTIGGANDWNMSTGASGYFFAANLDQYRNGGGSGTIQGLFSLRFNNDGKLTIYDEDAGHKVATAKVDPEVGSSVHFFLGYKDTLTTYGDIPTITKQSLSSSNQPELTFAPDVSNQSFSVAEGDAFTLQVALDAGSDIVNQYGEVDAPSWAVLNQTTGQLIGTAPAFTGSSDAYVVNCKAANAIGGITNFTVTINVSEVAYTNSKSLSFNGTSTWLQANPSTMTAFSRATNGDGNAWTIAMWMKPSTSTSTNTLFVFGEPSGATSGTVTVQQHGGSNILVTYGSYTDKVIVLATGCLTVGAWNHLVVTFDGGTTGAVAADLADYYSRFSIAVDGAVVSQIGTHANNGYDGSIDGTNTSDQVLRIGRDSNIHNNYLDGIINQVGIWDTDQSANIATIYNGGATQALSDLAVPPVHYYEIETSVTTIPDLIGSTAFTGYNFTVSDLVTDTP